MASDGRRHPHAKPGRGQHGTDLNAETAENAEGYWGKTANGILTQSREDAKSCKQEAANIMKP